MPILTQSARSSAGMQARASRIRGRLIARDVVTAYLARLRFTWPEIQVLDVGCEPADGTSAKRHLSGELPVLIRSYIVLRASPVRALTSLRRRIVSGVEEWITSFILGASRWLLDEATIVPLRPSVVWPNRSLVETPKKWTGERKRASVIVQCRADM
jgi:hypothetical protein